MNEALQTEVKKGVRDATKDRFDEIDTGFDELKQLIMTMMGNR